MQKSLQSSVLTLARDVQKILGNIRTGYVGDAHKGEEIAYDKGRVDVIIEALEVSDIADDNFLNSWKSKLSLMRSNLLPEEDLVW